MHQVGYRKQLHSEFEEDWLCSFSTRASTRVSLEVPRVSTEVCSQGAREMSFYMKEGSTNINRTV